MGRQHVIVILPVHFILKIGALIEKNYLNIFFVGRLWLRILRGFSFYNNALFCF